MIDNHDMSSFGPEEGQASKVQEQRSMCTSMQVVVFHGNRRTADPTELAGADVVLTTYSIIEGEHRRYVEPDKIPCKYCNKRFQPDRLEVHLRCEIDGIKMASGKH